MQPAQYQGFWWLPGQADTKTAGTLSFDDEGGLELEVLAPLTTDRHLQGSPPVPYVFGQVERPEKFGENAVVLLDSQLVGVTTGAGGLPLSTQRFRPTRAYIGREHLKVAEQPRFRRAEVRFSGLDAWADTLTGFQSGGEWLSVRWKHPEPVHDDVTGAKFRLGVACSGSSELRTQQITERVELHFTFTEPIGADELEEAFISPLQNYFTLVTDVPNALTELLVETEALDGVAKYTVVGPRTFTDESVAEEALAHRMLLPYSAIAGSLGRSLRAWLDLSSRCRTPLAMYFAGRYDPPRYVDLRFQLLLQAVAAVVRVLSPATGVIASEAGVVTGLFPPNYRGPTAKNDLLFTHPLVQAALALDWLRPAFGVLARKESSESWDRFRADVLNTLAHVLVRDVRAPNPPDGWRYYSLGYVVDSLFKISLFLDIGIDPDVIARQIDRHIEGREFLAAVTAPPPAG